MNTFAAIKFSERLGDTTKARVAIWMENMKPYECVTAIYDVFIDATGAVNLGEHYIYPKGLSAIAASTWNFPSIEKHRTAILDVIGIPSALPPVYPFKRQGYTLPELHTLWESCHMQMGACLSREEIQNCPTRVSALITIFNQIKRQEQRLPNDSLWVRNSVEPDNENDVAVLKGVNKVILRRNPWETVKMIARYNSPTYFPRQQTVDVEVGQNKAIEMQMGDFYKYFTPSNKLMEQLNRQKH